MLANAQSIKILTLNFHMNRTCLNLGRGTYQTANKYKTQSFWTLKHVFHDVVNTSSSRDTPAASIRALLRRQIPPFLHKDWLEMQTRNLIGQWDCCTGCVAFDSDSESDFNRGRCRSESILRIDSWNLWDSF